MTIVTKQYYKCPVCGTLSVNICSCGEDIMNLEQKEKFRRSSKWRSFRKKIREHTVKDYITRKELKRDWNLHHLDLRSENYTDLSDAHKFVALNKDTHKFIHWLFRIYRHDKQVLKRIEHIMEVMHEYIKQ